MRSTIAWLACGAGAAFPAFGAPSAELLDLAGRVHYGYYQAEPRVIEAAMAALERLAESPEALYYRDFAALRLAQLGAGGPANFERLEACAKRDALGLEQRRAAEAWVLVAACAQLAGNEGRSEKALARAREHDGDNPRIALVEALVLEADTRGDATQRDAVAAKLKSVVEAFDAWAPSIDDPDWGHAEALTALGAAALARGQVRTARDLIERALLLVPDYRAAVDVRLAMHAGSGGRTL
jgi:tetratricopeptide (TPR) repeat protein